MANNCNYVQTQHTLTWKTLRPFIHATNLDNVVLPAPLTPIKSKCPYEEEIRMCYQIILLGPDLDSYMRTILPLQVQNTFFFSILCKLSLTFMENISFYLESRSFKRAEKQEFYAK